MEQKSKLKYIKDKNGGIWKWLQRGDNLELKKVFQKVKLTQLNEIRR